MRLKIRPCFPYLQCMLEEARYEFRKASPVTKVTSNVKNKVCSFDVEASLKEKAIATCSSRREPNENAHSLDFATRRF